MKKMIRKKYIKLMAAFAVVTATLTACSNANSTAKENTTIEQTQDENKTQTQMV